MARLVPTVFVVDDDLAVRDSLCWLISAEKLPVQAFPSAEAFLETVRAEQPGCVIIDVRMPGMDGLEFQRELVKLYPALSTIVISGHGNLEIAGQAKAAGAMGYFEKPVDDKALLALVMKGIDFSGES